MGGGAELVVARDGSEAGDADCARAQHAAGARARADDREQGAAAGACEQADGHGYGAAGGCK